MKLTSRGASVFRILTIGLAGLSPLVAQAHVGIGQTSGLANGLAHPLSGLDHVCAMLAVGLWASQKGGRALWLAPLTFVSVMALGGVLGMAAISIPFVEKGIVASVLILGVMVAAAVRLPLAASVILVGLFALFHGHAHGVEMPATASGVLYGIGFVAATALLHSLGIALGLVFQRFGNGTLVRYAGGAIVACGLYLCWGLSISGN